MHLRLTEEDPEDIGFVYSALLCGAIDQSELSMWAIRVIDQHVDCPLYLLDLVDPPLKKSFDEILGFVPHAPDLSMDEVTALHGISVERCKGLKWPILSPVAPDEALAALARHPDIKKRFNQMFPFLICKDE